MQALYVFFIFIRPRTPCIRATLKRASLSFASRPIPKAVWRISEACSGSSSSSSGGQQPVAADSASGSASFGIGSKGGATSSHPLGAGLGGGLQGLGLRSERAVLQPDALWLSGLTRRRCVRW